MNAHDDLTAHDAPGRWPDIRRGRRWWQPAAAICWLVSLTGLAAADEPAGFLLVPHRAVSGAAAGGEAVGAPAGADQTTFDTVGLDTWLASELNSAPLSLRQQALLAAAAAELSFEAGALGPEVTLARFNELPAKLAGEQATPATKDAVQGFFQSLQQQLGDRGFDSGNTRHWREAMQKLAEAARESELPSQRAGEFGPWIAAEDTRPLVVQSGAIRPRPPWEVMVLGVALLAGTLFWVSFTVPDAIVRDSPRFRQALTVWHDVIAARCLTPRAVKRFMNRVRFFAMRQRSQVEDPSHAQYIAAWIRGLLGERLAPRQYPGAGAATDEALLVAVCAVQLFEPELLNNDDLWLRLRHGLSEQPTGMSNQRYALLRQAIDGHTALYGWPLQDTHRSELRRMFAEISVT